MNKVKWMQEKLVANLTLQSVIIMDNPPYHNVEVIKHQSRIPQRRTKTSFPNNVPFSKNMLKPELIVLIKTLHSKMKICVIDELLAADGYTALRLPL